MRGYGENLALQDWLGTRIFPFEDKLNGNAVYWGTLLCMMLSGGHSAIAVSGISTIVAILVAMVIYAVLIFLLKAITVEELETMPGGTKLAKIARKFIK